MFFRSSHLANSNNAIFVSREVSEKWGLFEGLTYEENTFIDIDIDQETLYLVMEYYNIIDIDDVSIPKPLPFSSSFVINFTNAFGKNSNLRRHASWIDNIATSASNLIKLWKLFEAANLLHAQKLLDLCSARIAFEFKNMSVKELQKCTGICDGGLGPGGLGCKEGEDRGKNKI